MILREISSRIFLHIILLVQPSIQLIPLESSKEQALSSIHRVSKNAWGALCITSQWLSIPFEINTTRYQCAQEQVKSVGGLLSLVPSPSPEMLKAIPKGLMESVNNMIRARIFHLRSNRDNPLNADIVQFACYPEDEMGKNIKNSTWWNTVRLGTLANSVDERNKYHTINEWSQPYYSCKENKWLISFSTIITFRSNVKSTDYIISVELDVSNLELNQCDEYSANNLTTKAIQEPLGGFIGTHKCPVETTKCVHRTGRGWSRGSYLCICKDGFYSLTHPHGFNGSMMEIAWVEMNDRQYNSSEDWKSLNCLPCAEGCITCTGPRPCLATYGWSLRTVLLCISLWCAACTFALAVFLYHHRRARVFRSASPIFLAITLLGCVIMYFEMLAIYPALDMYFCIATKWCRHLGFCITYTALLMKTWRVSLTYRVKSAHAVKLTERQLLRWLTPILLIMLVYLGTWTLSDPPQAENITDGEGLIFKQCTYNWWDHSLAFGELLFLLWGVRVCYGVRHAESLYNEAKLISYAIYNIAAVNCLMVTFHLLLFPQVGPDMKYFLGFLRTQLSTTVTIGIVFGPKVLRIWRGFGDQWDNRSNRGVSTSFSLNGIGSIHPRLPLTPHDLAQENDELKEEIQKLAAQIEFMKIVQMELHNRHLKPKPGGHFTIPQTQQASGDQQMDCVIRPI